MFFADTLKDGARHNAIAHGDYKQRVLFHLRDGQGFKSREAGASGSIVRKDIHVPGAERGRNGVSAIANDADGWGGAEMPECLNRVARERYTANRLNALRLASESRTLAGGENHQHQRITVYTVEVLRIQHLPRIKCDGIT
jgi:hypothetical protein